MSLERAVQHVGRFLAAPALLIMTWSGQIVGAVEPAPGAASLVVHTDRDGPKVSPLLYGIFFEDINCSADGGIYAELVRNRSFEDSDKLEHWSATSGGGSRVETAIDTSRPISPKNRRSLKVTIREPGDAFVGVFNEGYWGIPVEKGAAYRLSLQARGEGFDDRLNVAITSSDGRYYAKEQLPKLTGEWKSYECTLTSNGTDPRARLEIVGAGKGTFWLDMVSLFPAKTPKHSPLPRHGTGAHKRG